MEVAQDLFICPEDTGFVVGNGLLLAEGLDDFTGFAVVVSWHGWEKVMLYLVIQAAVQDIGQQAFIFSFINFYYAELFVFSLAINNPNL